MAEQSKKKVAVVTGASRGIGRAIALRLAQEGAAVVINYNGSKERAQEVKTEIESAGGTAQIMQCDVADAASCDEMFQTIIKEFGRIDILVNNAGIFSLDLFQMSSMKKVREIYETDVFGPMLLTQLILKKMTRQKQGNIINMSSAAALGANPGNSVYGSAKAALTHWTEILATEVTQNGIRVNAIAPGNIETDILSAHREDARTELEAASLMGRLGKPEEIAEVAVFLASDMSSFVNAQVISVNGGAS